MTEPTPPPAYCCTVAAFEGYAEAHQADCPYAAERQPQTDTLFDLPELKRGGQHL
ncbi:hypothetical protein [Nonomuraea terrae]|uniref:hypothetical protein n=1 Tax=Nonomuraea terrae TaxID=2530383 RepID=UPI0014044E15|nr:hypothetical protein [Nonomuraea terrae]